MIDELRRALSGGVGTRITVVTAAERAGELRAAGFSHLRYRARELLLYPPSHPGGITLDLDVCVRCVRASTVGVCRRPSDVRDPDAIMRFLCDGEA